MRKICLLIAILASIIGLIFAVIHSLRLIFVEEEVWYGILGLIVGCPMIIANAVVYGHVHDILPDSPSPNTKPKQKRSSVDCVRCGMLLKEGECPNCSS